MNYWIAVFFSTISMSINDVGYELKKSSHAYLVSTSTTNVVEDAVNVLWAASDHLTFPLNDTYPLKRRIFRGRQQNVTFNADGSIKFTNKVGVPVQYPMLYRWGIEISTVSGYQSDLRLNYAMATSSSALVFPLKVKQMLKQKFIVFSGPEIGLDSECHVRVKIK